MKIAMMVRGYMPAPRPADIVYAPIDLAVTIGEGLVKRGHQVDYYGPDGTQLEANVQTLGLRPLAKNHKEFQTMLSSVDLLTHYVPGLWDQYMSIAMFQRAAAGEYDLLHFHHPETAMPYAHLFPTVPVVYTLHDPIYELYQEIFKMFHSTNQYYISISNNQRLAAPDLPYIATVYNGIDPEEFPLSEDFDDYLLFVGRVTREKGVREAVRLALKTGHKLLIIGPVYDDGQKYFQKYVEPFLSDQIKYLGYFNRNDRLVKYFQKAKAFLMPIQWEEPFGLTMIEAMSCGVPVVAFHRGSVPEIVEEGVTGFIVDTIPQMIKALEKIDTIDRKACHQRVIEHFSNEKMVDDYEAAFKAVLKKSA